MNPATDGKGKFDPIKIIGQVFSYTKHIRLMLLMGALGLIAGIVYYTFSRPTYRSTALVYTKTYGSPIATSETPGVSRAVSRSFLAQFRSRLIQLGTAKRLGLLSEEATYEDLFVHVPSVRVAVYDSNHIEVKVLAYDPEVVRTFAQAMTEEYQDFQKKSWDEFRDSALSRYSSQMKDLESRIAESVESLTQMERDERLTEITIEQKSLLNVPRDLVAAKETRSRMQDVQKRLAASEAGVDFSQDIDAAIEILSILSSVEEATTVEVGDVVSSRQVIGDGPVARVGSPEVVVQPAEVEGIEPWKELEKERRILKGKIQEASKNFLPDHEVMRGLQADLASTERGMLSELEVNRQKFDRDLVKLEQEIEELNTRMPDYFEVTEKLAKSSQEYTAIIETRRMWDKARDELSSRLAAISFNEDFDWVDLRFKSFLSMRDQIPVSPSKAKLAMLSLLLGIAGAFGLPTFLNLFDTSATNVHQLEETTGLRGVGIVPLTSKEFLEEVHRSPAQGATIPNYLLECFRVIRANVCLHAGPSGSTQVSLVTSARPQEGKTSQASNLAWAFHSMGERTLLLDCDLRRGRVHELLKIDKSPGMTRLLMGEVTPQEAIVNSGLEGFDVIPRGPVIAGTTEILCQEPFERLLAMFRKHYDRIIIDSPPVLGLSESSSLQRLVDGTILVVRAEKTSRKDVLDAINLLKKSNAHFYGFVLNAVDLSKASNYYYYYYYSAPYYDQFEPDEKPELPTGGPDEATKPRRIAAAATKAEVQQTLVRRG